MSPRGPRGTSCHVGVEATSSKTTQGKVRHVPQGGGDTKEGSKDTVTWARGDAHAMLHSSRPASVRFGNVRLPVFYRIVICRKGLSCPEYHAY